MIICCKYVVIGMKCTGVIGIVGNWNIMVIGMKYRVIGIIANCNNMVIWAQIQGDWFQLGSNTGWLVPIGVKYRVIGIVSNQKIIVIGLKYRVVVSNWAKYSMTGIVGNWENYKRTSSNTGWLARFVQVSAFFLSGDIQGVRRRHY